MPRWAGSIALLAGIYIAVMLVAAMFLPHEWDWDVFGWLSARHAPAFSSEVAIVDLAWDPNDIAADRRHVVRFLDGLVASNQRPLATILDIEFGPCQSKPDCGVPMETARAALIASIRAATAHQLLVFATEEPAVDPRDDRVNGPLDPHDALIYGVLSGAAHTRFTAIPESEGLFYRDCYQGIPVLDADGKAQGSATVWAMVDRVRIDERALPGIPCDGLHIAARLGAALPHAPPAVYAASAARPFPPGADFNGRYVILGTMGASDQSPYASRSGPELLAWAFSNALDRASPAAVQTYYETRPQNGLLLVVVPAFSALAVLAFMGLFYPLKRARLKQLRGSLPWLAAGIAALAGLGIFAAFEFWMYASSQHEIYPQVTLISLGIVVASSLCGLYGFRILQDEAHTIDPTGRETYDYDVFISYAHDEGAWVAEHVYAAFRDATLPNGKKLSVFFDTATIKPGAAWQDNISLAISGSRFFVPVYSEIYFKKPYCRFEIKRAHRKWIAEGKDSRCVLPIMRGHPKIYGTVDDIQAYSIDDHPDLVQRYVTEIVERLARRPAAHLPESGAPPNLLAPESA